MSEDDVQALYKQVSATPQPRPKQIKSDYLENLRIKFLDTRPTLQLPEGQKTEEYALTEKAREQPSRLTVDDYAQLIYANVSDGQGWRKRWECLAEVKDGLGSG